MIRERALTRLWLRTPIQVWLAKNPLRDEERNRITSVTHPETYTYELFLYVAKRIPAKVLMEAALCQE
jgi:hypothetical protein